jgi:AP endonuclease 2
MKTVEKRDAPRLAAKYWDEFSGKQTLLSSFFRKGTKVTVGGSIPAPNSSEPQPSSRSSPSIAEVSAIEPSYAEETSAIAMDSTHTVMSLPIANAESAPIVSDSSSLPLPANPPQLVKSTILPPNNKRKSSEDTSASVVGVKKRKAGQNELSVLAQSPISTPPELASENVQTLIPPPPCSSTVLQGFHEVIDVDAGSVKDQIDTDNLLAQMLSASQESVLMRSQPVSPKSAAKSKAAWSRIFAPIPVPKCIVHNEPAKEWKVSKPGPNKGKTFYLCSRCARTLHRAEPRNLMVQII